MVTLRCVLLCLNSPALGSSCGFTPVGCHIDVDVVVCHQMLDVHTLFQSFVFVCCFVCFVFCLSLIVFENATKINIVHIHWPDCYYVVVSSLYKCEETLLTFLQP